MITDISRIDEILHGNESGYFNMDCMELMQMLPDNFADLAMVDPVYGGVSQGGFMSDEGGHYVGNGLGKRRVYHLSIWDQDKTPKEYFDELFRVTKDQVIWGGITLLRVFTGILNAGWYGISRNRRAYRLQMQS